MKKKGKRNPELFTPDAVLAGDWRLFVQRVPLMTENELLTALNFEHNHANRPAYVERLYRKYNSRRSARERKELLKT